MNNAQFSDRIAEFAHLLRDNGHLIGIKELTDSMRIVSEFNQPDEQLTRHYLRSLCCRNKEEWQQFDALFTSFWYPQLDTEATIDATQINAAGGLNSQGGALTGMAGTTTSVFEAIDSTNQTGAGKQNTITKADFRFLNNHQAMREAENLAEKLALQLKARTRVQRKIVSNGNRMDIRHTLRRNLSHGGIPLHPVFSIKTKKTAATGRFA